MLLRHGAEGEELPAIVLEPKSWNKQAVIWIGRDGKQSLMDAEGNPRGPVRRLLAAGMAVVGVDLLGQGESSIGGMPPAKARLNKSDGNKPAVYAGYTFGYNTHPCKGPKEAFFASFSWFFAVESSHSDRPTPGNLGKQGTFWTLTGVATTTRSLPNGSTTCFRWFRLPGTPWVPRRSISWGLAARGTGSWRHAPRPARPSTVQRPIRPASASPGSRPSTISTSCRAGPSILICQASRPYWHVGKRIRQEVLGEERAAYGEQIVSTLSKELTAEYGRGFTRTNLFCMMQFAEAIPGRAELSTHCVDNYPGPTSAN